MSLLGIRLPMAGRGIEIAENKAYTAHAFDMSTKELAGIGQTGRPMAFRYMPAS